MIERQHGGHEPERGGEIAEFNWKNGEIPDTEIEIKAVRGGGPGGQAINKTSNKMEVRWNIGKSRSLTTEQKATVRRAAGRRLTKNDEIIFTCQSERSQTQNTQEAIERLNQFIRRALTPKKKRNKTKKPRGQREKERRAREAEKRRRAGRGRVKDWE